MHTAAIVLIDTAPIESEKGWRAAIEEILAPYDMALELDPYLFKPAAEVSAWIAPYADLLAEGLTVQEQLDDLFGVDRYRVRENGDVYATANHRGTWDWWQVGGRWPGQLYPKAGKVGLKGTLSWQVAFDPYEDGGRDAVLLGDVDWDKTNALDLKTRADAWARFVEVEEMNFLGKDLLETYGTKERYLAAGGFSTPLILTEDEGWYEMPRDDPRPWGERMERVLAKGPEYLMVLVDLHS